LKSFEARLAALSPRDDRLDRERLMFLAGRASVESRPTPSRPSPRPSPLEHKAWPAAFAAMTTLAAALLVILVTRSEPARPSLYHATAGAGSMQTDMQRDEATTVLSTIDVYRGDINRLIANDDSFRREVDGSSTAPADNRAMPVLTPARWQDAIKELNLVRTSS
jgi:hypothetical protein